MKTDRRLALRCEAGLRDLIQHSKISDHGIVLNRKAIDILMLAAAQLRAYVAQSEGALAAASKKSDPNGEPRAPLEVAEAAKQRIAKALDSDLPPGWLFYIALYSMGEKPLMTWISNANRKDLLDALREFIKRFEANEPSL